MPEVAVEPMIVSLGADAGFSDDPDEVWEGEGSRVGAAVAGRSLTEVMMTCGTRYLWCRIRTASAREVKSVILVSERSLKC